MRAYRTKRYATDPAHRERQCAWARQQAADPAVKKRRRDSRIRRHADPAYQHEFLSKQRRLRGYYISAEDEAALTLQQRGLCAICQQPETNPRNKRLSVDHCHTTGKVRGLLCTRCNSGLGLFKDSAEKLDAAAAYLRAHMQGVVSDNNTTESPQIP